MEATPRIIGKRYKYTGVVSVNASRIFTIIEVSTYYIIIKWDDQPPVIEKISLERFHALQKDHYFIPVQ